MHLHMDFNWNFKSGYRRFLEMELRDVPKNKRSCYSSDREGYQFANGEYEKVTLREEKTKLGTFTLEEFKIHFKDWIDTEVNYIKKRIQNELDIEERKKQRQILMDENIHPENRRNKKPKTNFQLSFGNRYYVYNDKTYQVVHGKKVTEKLFSKYVEKPSNKEKEVWMYVDFVIAKIMKPSQRCTEIKIPFKEFRNRKFYIDKECTNV